MEVRLAKTAGFCFGVKRAVDTVYQQVREGEDWFGRTEAMWCYEHCEKALQVAVRRIEMIRENYKFGFDSWGLILFLVIMIPNFIWFAVPAPNDILRAESVTKVVDANGSVCQVDGGSVVCNYT